MTARDILKKLKADGWYIVRTKGSHIQLNHPTKEGTVTVPQHAGDISKGTLRSILGQAGLE